MKGKGTVSVNEQVRQGTERFWLPLILAVLITAAAGCSSGGGTGTGFSSIAGTVTYYDLTGQLAVPSGITVGVTGTDAWDTEVDSAGVYQIKGIPGGLYRVVVKEVKDLPPNATFITDPPGGVSVKLIAGIPMVDVNLSAVAMPGLPDL